LAKLPDDREEFLDAIIERLVLYLKELNVPVLYASWWRKIRRTAQSSLVANKVACSADMIEIAMPVCLLLRFCSITSNVAKKCLTVHEHGNIKSVLRR
jgi:hypothetical protein